MLNKRGQALSIVVFFAVIVAVFITSVVIMYFVNSMLTPFQSSISNISTTAGTNVATIQNGFNKWWDYATVLIFVINTLLLFISAFLIDVHPAFLLLYIFALLFLFVFGIGVIGSVQSIWNADPAIGATTFSDAVSKMPITNWLVNNFSIVLLGIAILSGVVMYAKFKFANGGAA